MTNWQTLLTQAEALNDAKKYQEVINLLTPELLEKYPRAELYAEKARGYSGLGNFDECLIWAEKAIAADSNYYKGWYYRGNVWLDKKECDKAIEDYSRAIDLNPDHAYAFNNRGNAWSEKKDYDKAIEDYSRAIDLNPDDAVAFNNRGTAWYAKKDNDKAIEDYSRAIDLNPDDADAFNNRGNAWSEKKNNDKAIQDYSRAIDLNPNYADAFNNRGVAWSEKKDYDKAIQDYSKAIEIDPQHFLAHRNLGDLWRERGNLEKAAEYYNHAIQIDPKDYWAKKWRDEVLAMLEKPIDIREEKPDEVFYAFNKALEGIENDLKLPVLKICASELKDAIEGVRQYATGGIDDEAVVHYTNLSAVDKIIQNKESLFRYSNSVFLNDPEEGAVFLDCLEPGKDPNTPIRQAFENGRRGEESNIYIGSFLPATGGHEDELLMWRTYGKDERGQDAAGCSLIISNSFFDLSDGGGISPNMRSTGSGTETGDGPMFNRLYNVIYFNKRNGGFSNCSNLEQDINKFKAVLKKLIGLKEEHKGNLLFGRAIDKIVYHSVSELRFFFKSADYAYENELRVIQYASSANKNVQINWDGSSIPRKTYIESKEKFLPHLRQIILGPRVPNPQQWMYLEAQMKKHGYAKMEMIFSGCKFQ